MFYLRVRSEFRFVAKQFVQVINGLRRTALDRKQGKKLLQFLVVEPQAMSARAFVERKGRRSRIGDLNLVQGGIAARAQMRAAFRLRARLLLEF